MAALLGIVDFDGKPVNREDLDRMAGAVAGPDVGIRIVREGAAGLAFAGDAFVAEDRYERQPERLPDGRLFAFCGRLDNRDELVRALTVPTAEAARMADSAIAARAWTAWGSEGLRRWIGPHASACWDPRQRSLVLVRGAPSGPSLITFRRGSTLYFATRLDGLFALPSIPRELDEEVLADVLLGAPAGETFLYRGLKSVATSHWVAYSAAGARAHRYWRLERRAPLRFASEEECWETFDTLFQQVLRQQLRTTGEIGIRLSGGLDSSVVAAYTARVLAEEGRILHSYTRVPKPGVPLPEGRLRYSDESTKVEALAKRYPNLKTNFIHPGDEPVMAGLEAWFGANYTPAVASPTHQSGYKPLLEKARDDGVKLLLNAGSGNNTLSYDGFGRLRELFLLGRWRKLRGELRAMEKRGFNRKKLLQLHVLLPSLPGWWHDWRVKRLVADSQPWDWFSSINPDFARATGALDRLGSQQNLRLYHRRWTSWQRRAHAYNHGQQITQGGGADRLYGFDQRDPTCDRRIIEFCLALPEAYYLDGGVNRRLVRRGMRHLLPDEIADDYALGVQDADWYGRAEQDRDTILRSFEQFRSDPDVKRYFDMDKLEAMWEEFENTDWSKQGRKKQARMQLALLGPLHAGHFVRWFYGRND